MPFIPRNFQRLWFGLHPLLRVLLIILAVVIPALIGWRPASRIYYGWRAKDDLKEASASLSKHDYPEARRLSMRVLSREPRSPEAIRTLLEAEIKLDAPRRTQIALMYLSLDNGDASGRLMAWETLSSSACTWLGASAWRTLKPHEASDLRFCGPWLARMRNEGLHKEALKLIESLPSPHSSEIERLEFEVLASQGETTASVTLQLRLETMLKEKSERALTLLETTDLLPFDSLMTDLAKAAVEALESKESRTLDETLRLARFRMLLEPARAELLFSESFARPAEENPFNAAKWALKCDRPGQAKALLMKVADGTNIEAYRLLSELFLKQAGWDDWSDILNRYPATDTPSWMDCDRAFLGEKKTDASVHSTVMARLDALTPLNGALIEPAKRASKLGMNELSRRLWIRAISEAEGPLPLSSEFSPLFRSLAQEQDEDNLLAVLTGYRFLEPGNMGIVTRQLYLACLKGRAAPDNIIDALSEKVGPATSPNHQIASVLALAYILNSEPEKAAAVTDRPAAAWSSMPPSQRVIRAIALQRTGRSNEAATLLKDFPWENLLPSERRVFEQLASTSP